MGCASSTPMVQTAGSDMLKAATHVADDATKTAEDAVQGAKDAMGKSLETAKETVTTTVEEVKHDVENTLKEKAGQLDEAKSSLMAKLHTGSNSAAEAATSTIEAVQQDVMAGKAEAEMAMKTAGGTLKQNVESLQRQSSIMVDDIESVLAQTDTETDSLKTTTPEPEIERAMANKVGGTGGDNEDTDEDHDNPPTPVPTLSELENLNNELLSHQKTDKAMGNDLTVATNDPAMTKNSATVAETTDKMPTTATTTSSTIPSNTSVTTTLETTKSSEMHITPIPIASATSIATAITSSMATALQFNQLSDVVPSKASTGETEAVALAAKKKAQKRDEKVAADRAKQRKMIQQLQDEKRPSTTEWEKYADMLALFRKHNPNDGFRRGGTLTKMSNQFGPMPIREKALLLGRAIDDDSSDSTSNRERVSPALRSSAKIGGRIQRPANARPTSANQRGATHGASVRRNSAAGNNGRKFDYNPARSRLTNNNQASNVSSGKCFNYKTVDYRITPPNGTQSHSQSPSPTHYKHGSVKSPIEMRSQHSHLGTNSCQRLERLHLHDKKQQQQQQQQHIEQLMYYGKSIATLPHLPTSPSPSPPTGGSSMPPDAMHHFNCQHLQPTLTRESSITSLSSLSTEPGLIRSFKSTNDLTSAHAQTLRSRPIRNTSSFLSIPRTSPFYLTKSYTDLYFSSSGTTMNNAYESNSPMNLRWSAQQRQMRDRSPYKVRERCEVCRRKYIKP